MKRGIRWLFWRSREPFAATVTATSSSGTERACKLKWNRYGGHRHQITFEVGLHGAPPGTGSVILNEGNAAVQVDGGEFVGLEGVAEVRLIEPHGGVDPPLLHRVFAQAREQGRIKEVDALLRDLLPGLEKVEILTDEDDPLVYLSYDDHALPIGLAGDGVQSLVRLSLELAAAPGGVVLIEEPETHEHPGAIRQSAKAIVAAVRRGIQVILTTHSLDLIDALLDQLPDQDLGLLSLYRLILEDGKLVSSHLDGPLVRLARGDIQDDLR